MKRAEELFGFERRSSASDLVKEIWQTESEPEESFISTAASQWEMVVTHQRGAWWFTVRGPETRAMPAPIPQDAEFFGIQFNHGTFMPHLPPSRLVDGDITLPQVTDRSVWLDGSAWEVPTPDNADVFVDRLARAGLLVHDPVAATAVAAVEGHAEDLSELSGLSTRTVERRVARATGLTRGAIRQMRRADRAVELLTRGVAPLDVVRLAGYADQPHLTRSLKRLVGQTPSEIAASSAAG